ncbi:hypothetical protein HBH1_02073 [Herbaspirillum sp. BH-1]|uniref:hypothetical protein n=1 Tax=Herbaspirillum sp. (strain BH-1) TaxID=2058884 RepID=UPI000C888AD6|nr:hypothetical protein [Herbaspirillum sp. BH-1]PLY59563.1 hypothetical protein HBH1_02073 [Herbaspirillum sp. BH-1]
MAAVTFLSVALAIYLGFFYEKKPMLVGTINSLSPVFDVLKPVGGLDISYRGVNLREAKKSLWSVELTLRNDGSAAIKRDDFDPDAPVRIAVKDAQVVDRPSLSASNEYLSENVKITPGASHVALSPAIIEPGDTITINFLVLGAEGSRPTINILGKISGMQTIPLSSAESTTNRKSWWIRTVQADSIWIQLLRGPTYFIAFLGGSAFIALFIAAITSPFARIRETRARRSRNEEIRKLRREHAFDQRENSLADEYIEKGVRSIAKIAKEVSAAQLTIDARNTIENGGDEEAVNKVIEMLDAPMSERTIKRLTNLNLITVEDGNPVGVVELYAAVRSFCQKIGKSPDELIKDETENNRMIMIDDI